jgi:threonine dehydratase
MNDMNPAPGDPKALRRVVRPTTIIDSAPLSKRLGVDLTIASETFQHTGSFKFRAAYNVASQVLHQHIITASSGNFGQALAYASGLFGKSCTVVMPSTSARVKIDAVAEYGGKVDLVDVRVKTRAERLAEIARERPDAYKASAYDDPMVIEGSSTLGEELMALGRHFDYIVVPIGGGGLAAGIITGINRSGNEIKVVGAEPAIANDAARSLRAGFIVANASEPETIADGGRTMSLGRHNWAILQNGLAGIVEVSEEFIKEGLRLLFGLANLKVEPTGALSIGALLSEPEKFKGKTVCCVISGGNVDPEVYRRLLA